MDRYDSLFTNERTKFSGLFLLQRVIWIQLMKGGDLKPLLSDSCLTISVEHVNDLGLPL